VIPWWPALARPPPEGHRFSALPDRNRPSMTDNGSYAPLFEILRCFLDVTCPHFQYHRE
jgi:hypothetical protein